MQIHRTQDDDDGDGDGPKDAQRNETEPSPPPPLPPRTHVANVCSSVSKFAKLRDVRAEDESNPCVSVFQHFGGLLCMRAQRV